MITSLKELNKKKLYTGEQLLNWKKFQNVFINVYPHHYDYWKDGVGYETVYEVRGISNEVRENYLRPIDIVYGSYRD